MIRKLIVHFSSDCRSVDESDQLWRGAGGLDGAADRLRGGRGFRPLDGLLRQRPHLVQQQGYYNKDFIKVINQ